MIQVSGYAAQQVKAPLAPYSFARREPRDYDIMIDIQYCGICHTDIHQVRDEWGASTSQWFQDTRSPALSQELVLK
jgi:alcohol dehydrogenase (NADP+)